MNNQKLMLIDGNSVLNRAFFALPPLNDKDGKNVNAVYGFVNILLKIISTYQPDKGYLRRLQGNAQKDVR